MKASPPGRTPARRPIEVIKVGGHQLDDPDFVAGLAGAVAALRAHGRDVVVVHGGGRGIDALSARLGLPVRRVDGLRVTDDAMMDVVEMGLGLANKRLVAAFVIAGLDALGLSGVDRGLVRAGPMASTAGDLGRVGEVAGVRCEVLLGPLSEGVVPVVSPVGLGEDGRSRNVNADAAASAIAVALRAQRLSLVSNVPGVLLGGRVAPSLTPDAVDAAIESGDIGEGMLPKVQGALSAVAAGIDQVRIVDLAGLASPDGGTTFSDDRRDG